MSSYQRFGSQSYAPSAPALPEDQNYASTPSPPPPANNHGYNQTQLHTHGTAPYGHSSSPYGHSSSLYGHSGSLYGQSGYSPYGQTGSSMSSSYGYSGFPQGTSPDVIRSFEMVDRDRSGFIDENELQQALSSGYQRFCLRTIRLLMFLFKNPHDPLRIGNFFF